jgi:hypothetical protein
VAIESSVRPSARESFIGLPLYILGAVVVLGGALFYYLQFVSNRPLPELPLTPEAKAYVHNLKLDDVNIKASESYFKQVVIEIEGKVANSGDRSVSVVDIYCVFYDNYGQLVLRRRVPIVSKKMGGLNPGETKPFRLPFDDLPESWNHAMPRLVIAGIKFS